MFADEEPSAVVGSPARSCQGLSRVRRTVPALSPLARSLSRARELSAKCRGCAVTLNDSLSFDPIFCELLCVAYGIPNSTYSFTLRACFIDQPALLIELHSEM